MQKVHKEIIDYILQAGKRLQKKSGKVADIGVIKKYLTHEDVRIERDLKKIIKKFNSEHELYSEEENFDLPNTKDVWVADPISSTKCFIMGMPHYAIVVTQLSGGKPQFAVVYDPTMNDLYVAFRGRGAYKNGKKIKVKKSDGDPSILFNFSYLYSDLNFGKEIFKKLLDFKLYKQHTSFAVGYCYVACGYFDAIVTLGKNSFPEYAGSLIIKEAGGIFCNEKGEDIKYDNRIFVGGEKKIVQKLLGLVKETKK